MATPAATRSAWPAPARPRSRSARGRARAPSPWLVPLLTVLPVLPGLAIHTTRLATRPVPLSITLDAPGSAGGAIVPVPRVGLGAWRLHAGQGSAGGAIVPVLRGRAALTAVAGTVQLRVPPGSLGYLEVHLPRLGARAWYLPRALLDPAHALVIESVTWSARVEREGAYLGLAWIDRIDLQLTDAGVLVTHPAPDGDTVASRLEAQPPRDDWATWTLQRARGTLSLLLAGDVVWRAPDPGPFQTIRIGETRPDPGHGGVIWLRALRYERRLGSPGSPEAGP